MAKRSSGPPLYELMSRVRAPSGSADEGPAAPRVEPEAIGSRWLRPGNVVRLPVGMVLIGVAGILGIVIAAYLIGAWRGADAREAEVNRRLLEARSPLDPDARPIDPLASPEPDPPPPVVEPQGGRAANTPPPPPPATGSPSEPVTETPSTGNPEWGPIESDPRIPGRHYHTVSETRPEGAVRLAEFCRAAGLEAYVVPGHNPRFRRVVTFPGFDTGSASDPVVLRWKREILLVGREWKSRYPGEHDLSDAYLERAPQ